MEEKKEKTIMYILVAIILITVLGYIGYMIITDDIIPISLAREMSKASYIQIQ